MLKPMNSNIRHNVDMSKLTWFGVGGHADLLFKPNSTEELSQFLKQSTDNVTVVGAGSNILIRDGGLRGVTVRLGRGLNHCKVEDGVLKAGCATLDSSVSKIALENSISGYEFFIGVPGTVGGAIEMNAGAYGMETKDMLISAIAVSFNGEVQKFTNEELTFKYRGHDLEGGWIFTEAEFKIQNGDQSEIEQKMKDIQAKREATQPIHEKTGGSIFKNPNISDVSNDCAIQPAWKLIQSAGCRGLSIGDAQISEKHCNFLVNNGSASASQVEQLCIEVQQRVLKKHGILLDFEIRFLGDYQN